MARLSDTPAQRKKWTEEDRRLLDPERVKAYVDALTALSRQYGIRIENIGNDCRSIRVINVDDSILDGEAGHYRVIDEQGRVGWGFRGHAIGKSGEQEDE